MKRIPRRLETGKHTLQDIVQAVRDIIDYLPTLKVKGDGKTCVVDYTEYGQKVKALTPKGHHRQWQRSQRILEHTSNKTILHK